VEFTEPAFVAQALVLNESVFRGRNLKVCSKSAVNLKFAKLIHVFQVDPKRTNLPGMTRGRGRGGMRGGRGFGGGRGSYPPRGGYRGGYRGGRGRGYSPY